MSDSSYPTNLRPESWRPSPERVKQIDDFLWDQAVMRVFCDCSLSARLKAYGVAAAYVFDGSVTMRSRKLYTKSNLQSVHGELQALLHALQQLKGVLEEARITPEKIMIFTDIEDVDRRLNDQDSTMFAPTSQQILLKRSSFTQEQPTISSTIISMAAEEKRHNPFYKAAHNAARKEILIR